MKAIHRCTRKQCKYIARQLLTIDMRYSLPTVLCSLKHMHRKDVVTIAYYLHVRRGTMSRKDDIIARIANRLVADNFMERLRQSLKGKTI